MPVKSRIEDPTTGIQAAVVPSRRGVNALLTAQACWPPRYNRFAYFSHPTFGRSLKVSAVVSGDAAPVFGYAGQWTPSAISGTWNFTATSPRVTDPHCIDGTATVNGSTAQFLAPAPIDLADYSVFVGHFYIQSWDTRDYKEVRIRFYNGTDQVGPDLLMSNLIDPTLMGEYQRFTVSLTGGLASGTIDRIHVTNLRNPPGDPIDFYMDALALFPEGLEYKFTVLPRDNRIYNVTSLEFFLAAGQGVPNEGDMPNVPYNRLLGGETSLTSGVLLRQHRREQYSTIAVIRSVQNILALGGVMDSYGDDGVRRWVKISVKLAHPITLFPSELEYLSLTVQDDLATVLEDFWVSVTGFEVEERFTNG